VTIVPESREVRRWRWRQEDAAFDRRDAALGRLNRFVLIGAVLAAALLVALA
jgi:hypothetical protein